MRQPDSTDHIVRALTVTANLLRGVQKGIAVPF